jgi:hypothetical protein
MTVSYNKTEGNSEGEEEFTKHDKEANNHIKILR